MRIAIIGGSGKMGRWFANFLLNDGKEVVISGRNERKLREAQQQLGVRIATNVEAVKGADVVLLSVPIESFEEVVTQISPYIKPRQVVIDITSIKVFPVAIMHKHLKTGLVLGAHPLFGPGARSIVNQNFILTPTNEEERVLAQKIREYLESKGARVSLMTPDQHDEKMTTILGLSHFIAIVSADTLLSSDKLSQTEAIDGITYKMLLTLVESVISEEPEFYASLQMNLPNITEIEELFQGRAKVWADLVKNKDRQNFVR
ncbi:prephenate dehydrogenase, partial [Dehalococcoidales bacterium]|nr:prephenate dehydrogenase [Dehalococcoidales bacterium]